MRRRRSVVALLVVAFVGYNLLLGATCRGTAKSSGSSDPAYGTVQLKGRRLRIKEITGHIVTNRKAMGLQNIRADDYQPVDPSPSSKARTTPGPIEHGTHLLPYVPPYTPPPAVQSPHSPGEG